MAKWLDWEKKILRERSGIDRSTSILMLRAIAHNKKPLSHRD